MIEASTVSVKTMADPVLYERLIAKADTSAAGGCWEWTAALQTNGYGSIQVRGRRMGAHRAMWVALNGQIETKTYVCHKCDNKRCVNPDHLFSGSAADNNKDRAEKGRSFHPKGERNPMAKASDADVSIALNKYRHGANAESVASEHGVSVGAVRYWVCRSAVRVGKAGQRNGRALLTEENVAEIRRKLVDGQSQMSLGREFGVSGHAIWRIANGKGWK